VSGPATRRGHFLSDVLRRPGPFALRVAGSQRVLADPAVVAGDSAARRRGLLGRQRLPQNEALVIAPTQGIHTFGMSFPIDVAFVDRDGRVLRVAPAVPPRRIRLSWRAFAAIELAAGRCAEIGIGPGTTVVAQRVNAAV
jgi:uncharacterized membrane protein (UPF0127 family)